MLTNDTYGIFANSVEVTLTPGSADALLRIDNLANDDGGIIVDCLNLAEGAKVDAKSPEGIAVEASDLHVGADVVLNANGGWQGIDVICSNRQECSGECSWKLRWFVVSGDRYDRRRRGGSESVFRWRHTC